MGGADACRRLEGQHHLRAVLCYLIEAQPAIMLVGAFGPRPDLSVRLLALRPDVVLLDWELPTHLAPQVPGALRRVFAPVRVIVFSARSDDEPQALAAGADAFVGKDQPPEALLRLLSN
jgi:DNA-binding NarL/FixJ family response regulator